MFEPLQVYHNASVGSSIPGSPIVENLGEFLLFSKSGVGACLKIGSRLRSATQIRNQGRFPVKLG